MISRRGSRCGSTNGRSRPDEREAVIGDLLEEFDRRAVANSRAAHTLGLAQTPAGRLRQTCAGVS